MANFPLTLIVIAVAIIQVALATYNYYPPCDPPHRPDYGGYGPIRDSYRVGSKIKFYCNSGYRRHGASYSVCRYSGKSYWAHKSPVCKPITCPNLDDLRYGRVQVSGYIFNSTASYHCDAGYRLVGYGQRRCLYGYWTGKAPICQKTTTCPIRGDPAYGSIRATGYTPGSTIHYRCNKGFKLVGQAWQKCLRTGYWSGEEPVCKSIVQCPDLDDPVYGSVNVTDNTPGSTAHYECDEGFELVGEEYCECLYNGYWSGEAPVCKRIIECPDLDDPLYGSVNVTDNTTGSTAHYECDEGFKLVGEEYRECLYNGYWSGEAPVCKKIVCPDLDDPRYGSVNVTDNTPGSTAHYECDEGFELVGEEYRECLYNGYWSGEAPVCKRIIECPDLDDPLYGSVNVTDNTTGSTAHYECEEGFKLVGEEYRECLDTGYWSGEAPVCKRIIVCPYLDDPRYGSVNVADNTPGSTAHYECDKGFKLVGEEYRKCLYNGYWSGDEPVCKRIIITCPHIPPPKYGKIDVRGYTPTSKAYYSCEEGYELVGSGYRQCRYDGSWYGRAPVCRPKRIVVCPKLDTPRYGRVYVRSYTPSSVAYYSCNRGYRRQGLQYRKCQHDGSWYGSAPTCERVNYYHKG